jgi:hypothetical protein
MSGLRAYDIFMAERDWLTTPKEQIEVVRALQIAAQSAPIFLIDDALRLLDHTLDSVPGQTMRLGSFPPIAIPFNLFWMEYQRNDAPIKSTGYLCVWEEEARKLWVNVFHTLDRDNRPPHIFHTCGFSLTLDESGAYETGSTVCYPGEEPHSHGEDEAATQPAYVLFSLGLLSCKNVEKVEAKLPRHIRRHPPQSELQTLGHSHYVLDIPGAKQFRDALESAGEAGRKRLHIVRGHFADYTNGGGLFGKLHGRYYISPHVRGNAERGTITKDYNVRASA